MNSNSILNNEEILKAVVAIMIKRLGGKVIITQKDAADIVDATFYESIQDGVLEFCLKPKVNNS